MNLRRHSSRLAVLAVLLAALMGAWSGPAWSFSVNAPQLDEMTGSPETPAPGEEPTTDATTAPEATGMTPGAPTTPGGPSEPSPTATEAAPQAAAPTTTTVAQSSSNWPLIILMSVCGVGLVLIGLFLWSRRQED